jgi:hypothetical protein
MRHPIFNAKRTSSPLPSIYSMINAILIVGCIVLVSCSARFPVTIIMQNKILRGSASGILSDIVSFSVNNGDGLFCEGKMLVLSSEATTEGTIDCSNKRKGNFVANGKKASWAGEGTLDDGSRFFISISR